MKEQSAGAPDRGGGRLVPREYRFLGRIRQTERRVRELRIQHGPTHPGAIAARMELDELTGRSGDARGAAQLYDGLGQDCCSWFGPHDRKTLDAFEGIARWTESTAG
jgi:hypothetical protein